MQQSAKMAFRTPQIGDFELRTASVAKGRGTTVVMTNALPQSIRCWESQCVAIVTANEDAVTIGRALKSTEAVAHARDDLSARIERG